MLYMVCGWRYEGFHEPMLQDAVGGLLQADSGMDLRAVDSGAPFCTLRRPVNLHPSYKELAMSLRVNNTQCADWFVPS